MLSVHAQTNSLMETSPAGRLSGIGCLLLLWAQQWWTLAADVGLAAEDTGNHCGPSCSRECQYMLWTRHQEMRMLAVALGPSALAEGTAAADAHSSSWPGGGGGRCWLLGSVLSGRAWSLSGSAMEGI